MHYYIRFVTRFSQILRSIPKNRGMNHRGNSAIPTMAKVDTETGNRVQRLQKKLSVFNFKFANQ